MKSFKSLVKPACAIVLTLGMISPLVVFAKDNHCNARAHHMGAQPQQFKKLAKKLDLSDQQKVQVQALVEQMKSAREADKGKVKAQRDAFRNLVESNASEAELKAQADQMAAGMSEHMVQASLNMRAFRAILTPEQLAKMDAMKAERDAKRDAKRKQAEEKRGEKE